jgi:hypothetical protein
LKHQIPQAWIFHRFPKDVNAIHESNCSKTITRLHLKDESSLEDTTPKEERTKDTHAHATMGFRRFRKRFMHPHAENEAMVDLENSIKNLKNALRDRNIPDEELEQIQLDVKQCNYGAAICRCIEHIRKGFREDKELIFLLSPTCTALLVYHDLRYDRITEEYRRGIARGLWPSWYADFKARRLEHHRKVVKHCLKWSQGAENVRFNLIMKHDKLARKQKEKESEGDSAKELKPTKSQDCQEEKQNDVTEDSMRDECKPTREPQDLQQGSV